MPSKAQYGHAGNINATTLETENVLHNFRHIRIPIKYMDVTRSSLPTFGPSTPYRLLLTALFCNLTILDNRRALMAATTKG